MKKQHYLVIAVILGLALLAGSVSAANQAPVAMPDSYSTRENTKLNVGAPGILANDWDPDGDRITSYPLTSPDHGTFVTVPDGSFTYLPEPGFSGTDSFTYMAHDSTDYSAPARVTITVVANNPPVAVADSYSTKMKTKLSVGSPGILANDWDPDGDRITSYPLTSPDHGTFVTFIDGSFTYLPEPGFSGTDGFTYMAHDSTAYSAPVKVTITVRANQPVAAVPDAYSTAMNTALTAAAPGVLANDNDPDGDSLAVSAFTGASHGAVSMQPDGSFLYTPDTDFTGTDSFQYIASDGDNGDSLSTTVTITVDSIPAPEFPTPAVPFLGICAFALLVVMSGRK